MSVSGVCFFFKQKTAYELRSSDWSSDVCSSVLQATQGRSSGRNDGPVKPSIREMIEAAPRRLPRAAVAVEHDHRVAGHDAADACHRHAGIGARNLVESFACCRKARFETVATLPLQNMARVGTECGRPRRSGEREEKTPDPQTLMPTSYAA